MSKLLAILSAAVVLAGCVLDEPVDELEAEAGDADFRCGYVGVAGVIGLDKVSISGTPAITGSHANVFSNKTVTLSGNFEIEGDVIGQKVTISGSRKPDGRIVQNAPPITVADPTAEVSYAASHNDNSKIPCVKKGNKCTSPVSGGVLTLSGSQSIKLPAGTYSFSSISISGQAQLDISGQVRIYITGSATLNGGSSTNPSKDSLTLVSRGTGDVKLNGNADSQLVIYAPFAAVRFSGTQGFHGNALGKELYVSGNADIEPTGELTPVAGATCPKTTSDRQSPAGDGKGLDKG